MPKYSNEFKLKWFNIIMKKNLLLKVLQNILIFHLYVVIGWNF